MAKANTLPGFDGKDVEIPDDLSKIRYVSNAAKLLLHRKQQKETVHVNGNAETRIIKKDPIQFIEGFYPGPGGTLTPQEFAELETHPFNPKKFERLKEPETAPVPAIVATTETSALLEELKARAAAGDEAAKAAVEAMEPKTGGGTAEGAPAPKQPTKTRKTKATQKPAPKAPEASGGTGTGEKGTDEPTTIEVAKGDLTAAAEAATIAGAVMADLQTDGKLDAEKIVAAAAANGLTITGL